MARKKKAPAKPLRPKPAPRHNPFRAVVATLRETVEPSPAAAPSPRVEPPRATTPPTDTDAFAGAMAGVKPLPQGGGRMSRPRQATTRRERPDTTATQAAEEATFDLLFETLDLPGWAANSGDPELATLMRGGWPVDATLDLHGFREDAAVRRLRSFLGEARQRSWRCLRIVHGQGHHSGGAPILGDACRRSLKKNTALVQAWCETLPADGGRGATLVLLRRP